MDAQVAFGIAFNLLQGIGLILLGHLNGPLNHLILSASFGGYASREHEDLFYGTAFLLGFILSYSSRKRLYLDQLVSQIRIIWAFAIPLLQLLLKPFYESLGPTDSPLLLNISYRHILVFLGAFNATTFLLLADYRQSEGKPPPSISNSLLSLGLGGILLWPNILFSPSSLLQRAFTTPILAAIANPINLQLLHAGLQMLFSPRGGRPMTLIIMPFLLGTILFIPNLSPNRINRTLEPQNWTLLDRAWSTTGYISVLENHSAGYRVLRCDHSLLGGEWLLTHHRREKENWIVAEPTYAVFEMLEAVRLVTSPDIPALADKDAKALVIGLGIGTAPKALIAHGIDTTIVEIDSKIHEFATRYFELPGNHTSVTADATEWIARRSGSHSDSDSESTNTNTGKESEKYDYIIHDVFTGGASPLELFTAEFLLNLRGQLKAGSGVIAINYAGDLSLSLTRHVLRTIENVFDGRRNCRVYRDGDAPLPPAGERDVEKKNSENDGKKESQYTTDGTDSKKSNKDDDDNANANAETSHSAAQKTKKNKKTPAAQNQNKKEKYDDIAQADFTNIIIFCRNTIHSSSPSTAEKPKWSFRPPTPSDYLQTHSRRQYLLPKDEYEIAFPPSFTSADPSASDLEDGSILEAGNQDLWAEQQLESARRHWGLMRKVVPGVVWDTW